MARPNWEYIRVDVLLPSHPKLGGGNLALIGLLVTMWCYSGQYLTDGFIPEEQWRKFGTPRLRGQLVQRGFAEPVPGGYMMHDYLGHQRSREQARELSDKRRAAGSLGGQAKAGNVASGVASAKQMPDDLPPLATASKPSKGLATRVVPEAEAEVVKAEVSSRANGSSPDPPDSDSISQLIISEVAAVTGKTVTPAWAVVIGREILGSARPDNPAAYLRQSIRSEPNPVKRFLPTNQPPRIEDQCRIHFLVKPCPVCQP